MHYPISPIQSNFLDTSSCIFNFSKFPKKKSETKQSKILATYWDPLRPTGPTFSMYSSASVHFWVTSGRRSSKDFFSRSSASACFTCCSAWVLSAPPKKWVAKIWTKAGILVEKSWGTLKFDHLLPERKMFVLFDFCILVLLCRAILRNEKSRVWQCQRLLRTKNSAGVSMMTTSNSQTSMGFYGFFLTDTKQKLRFRLRPGCAILVNKAGEAPLCHPGMGCSLLNRDPLGYMWIQNCKNQPRQLSPNHQKVSYSLTLMKKHIYQRWCPS